jgi:hypothetical protein
MGHRTIAIDKRGNPKNPAALAPRQGARTTESRYNNKVRNDYLKKAHRKARNRRK